jgi:hypothetical protein
MAVFLSNQLTAPVTNMPGVGLGGRTLHHARAEITTLAPITTADSLELFDLPPRARIVTAFVKTTDLDTGVTLAFNIGSIAVPALLFAASVIGQAGGVDRNLATAGTDFLTSARTRIRLVPTANAAGWTNGTISVVVGYIVEEPA